MASPSGSPVFLSLTSSSPTQSQPGSLAGEPRIIVAAFRQCGAIHAVESDEAWHSALAWRKHHGRSAMRSSFSPTAVATRQSSARRRNAAAWQCLARHGESRTIFGDPPARSAVANPADFAGVAEEEPEVIRRMLDSCLAGPETGWATSPGISRAPSTSPPRMRGRRSGMVETVLRHSKPVRHLCRPSAACARGLGRVIRLVGFVNAVEDFGQQPTVIDGASDLLIALYGDCGRPARSAIGMKTLPPNVSVDIELIVEMQD